MTCMIEETERNLLMMKKIFESFADLYGLDINEGKTKVIRIGIKLNETKPHTNLVKFTYDTEFTLLGVNIDNKFSFDILRIQTRMIPFNPRMQVVAEDVLRRITNRFKTQIVETTVISC